MKAAYDLICISHLRWDFVYQRPQHLMSRAARDRRVYFVEEPIRDAATGPRLETRRDRSGVNVVVPHLPEGLDETTEHAHLRALLEQMLRAEHIVEYALWVYSPMTMPALSALKPSAVVYDCMDELANFRFAPPELRERERALFAWADLVFTGGHSLYEAKRRQHQDVHAFPSSVDVPHFATARTGLPEPEDMRHIPRPRIGFYGVLDERLDTELVASVASMRPEWQFVLVGPVVKIAPEDLPRAENIHYIGQKSYQELPAYLAHWDVAALPFALNEATEFISPTKTPEYLAAGRPVVSTPIRDVVRPYGERGLVLIARTPEDWVAAIERLLREDPQDRRARADALVGLMSWDRTWRQMNRLINEVVDGDRAPGAAAPRPGVAVRPTADAGAAD